MILRTIEILRSDNTVITKVANSTNPDKDMRDYKGVSWRDYTIPVEERVGRLRKAKLMALRQAALSRIREQVPALGTFAMLNFMVTLWPMLDATKAPAEITLVKRIYQYALSKMAALKTATEAQLNAYDPTTDTGWPT